MPMSDFGGFAPRTKNNKHALNPIAMIPIHNLIIKGVESQLIRIIDICNNETLAILVRQFGNG